jgi:LPS export ABC transporter protein LptC
MLKKNLIIFIILIFIFWLLFIFINNKDTTVNNKKLSYKEKTTNLSIREFDSGNKLVRKTTAKTYTTFQNKNNIFEKPKLQSFSKNFTNISADFAKQITNNKIEFIGNIKILNNGVANHSLNTESLFANIDKNLFYGDKDIEYISNNNKITSQGIEIISNKNIVKLIKKSNIFLENGNKIIGKNINIKKNNNSDKISSKFPAKFIGVNSTIDSDKGFILSENRIIMLGKSSIKQDNVNILTNNLRVVGDSYEAKKSKYSEDKIKIKSNNLYFDENKQLIKLSGNVKGTYD